MMHAKPAVIAALATIAFPGPSLALEASDTMAVWKGASAAEKSRFVTELLKRDGREGGAAAVVRCLDAASGVPGHVALPIGKVVEACADEQGDPV